MSELRGDLLRTNKLLVDPVDLFFRSIRMRELSGDLKNRVAEREWFEGAIVVDRTEGSPSYDAAEELRMAMAEAEAALREFGSAASVGVDMIADGLKAGLDAYSRVDGRVHSAISNALLQWSPPGATGGAADSRATESTRAPSSVGGSLLNSRKPFFVPNTASNPGSAPRIGSTGI